MRQCRRVLLVSVLSLLLAGLPFVAPAQAAALIVVTGGDAGAGTCTPAACTLRDAIAAAATGDTITFANSVPSPITLTQGELAIDKNLTITGPTGRVLAVDGNANGRVFHIGAVTALTLTVSNLTIQNGRLPGSVNGAGLYVHDGSGLVLIHSTVRGNVAVTPSTGGGIFAESGTTVTLTDVTISGNSAGGQAAMNAGGQATLTNVTVSGNTSAALGNAALQGGAMGQLHLVNVTVARNTGVGVAIQGIGDAKNTIVASNTPFNTNCGGSGGAPSSLGNNLEFPGNTCNFNQPSDVHADPLLGALRLNAPGLLETMALLAGSPAIDAGTGSGCPAADERGVKRPKGAACDIGAYEFVPRVTGQGAVAVSGGSASFRIEALAPTGGGTPTGSLTWQAPSANVRSSSITSLVFGGTSSTSRPPSAVHVPT
jgi:Right handed beta helix region